jgi:hypothetical protein
LAIQAIHVVDGEIAVVEEHDMRAVLPGDTVADGAMAGMVIDRVVIGMGVAVVAPAGVFV